jgi:hypothetical protein
MPGNSAGHASSLRVLPWHSPYNWGKKAGEKTSVRVVKKCQLGTIHHVDMATFWQVVTTSLSTPVSLGKLEKMCVNTQRRYLPRGSSSANCESNLLVKAVMRSAKNATPKSSRICLLQMYQGKIKAVWRQLDWSLQFPGIGMSGGPPDGVHIIHHRIDKLLIQQNSIPDEQTTPPI